MLDIFARSFDASNTVIPERADTVGRAKSSVSWQMIEALELDAEALMERRLDQVNSLIIYIDGMEFDSTP